MAVFRYRNIQVDSPLSGDGKSSNLRVNVSADIDNELIIDGSGELKVPTPSLSDISDVPAIGTAGQALVVNGAGTGHEYVTPSSGVTTFQALSDTDAFAPAAADANKLVKVNATGDGLEYVSETAHVTVTDGFASTSTSEASSANNAKVLRDKQVASGAVLADDIILTLVDASTLTIDAKLLKDTDTDDTLDGDGNTTPLSVAYSADAGNMLSDGSDGKVYWNPRETISAEVSSASSAALFENIPVDVSAGAVSITAPTPVVSGDWFEVTDSRYFSGSNPITVDLTGVNIHGTGGGDVSNTYEINVNGGIIRFVYMGASIGWAAKELGVS